MYKISKGYISWILNLIISCRKLAETIDKTKYKILNLKNEDNYFTNLALLLSDECHFSIKCAVFSRK